MICADACKCRIKHQDNRPVSATVNFNECVEQSSANTRTKIQLLEAIPSAVESMSDDEVSVLASTLHKMPGLIVLRSSSSAASATKETPAMAALSHFLYAADATVPPKTQVTSYPH
jgi:hypothetical protein